MVTENECCYLIAPFLTRGQGSEGHEPLLGSWQVWIEERDGVLCVLEMR